MRWSRETSLYVLLGIDTAFFFVEIIVGQFKTPKSPAVLLLMFGIQGFSVGSLALVADSFHMLNDVVSLIVALYAIKMANSKSTAMYSYGWQRAEVLGALINGVFLLALCFSIFLEAIERLFNVKDISQPKLVVIVGSLGLLSNIVGLFLFHDHGHAHGGHSHSHSHSTGSHSHASHGHTVPNSDPEHSQTESGEHDDALDDLYMHPSAHRASLVRAGAQTGNFYNRRQSASLQSPTKSSTPVAPLIDVGEVGVHHQSTAPATPTPHSTNQSVATEDTVVEIDEHDHAHHDDHGSGHGHGHGSADGNMNMRGVFLHVLGDAAGNVGVIASGLVIWLTEWSGRFYFDPAISLVITCIIFSSALPLVKSASRILLQGTPAGVPLEEVRHELLALPGIVDVHESKVIGSVHVLVKSQSEYITVSASVRSVLHSFGIHSSTIQPEFINEFKAIAKSARSTRTGGTISEAEFSAAARNNSCLVSCVDACPDPKCCSGPPTPLSSSPTNV